MRCHLFNFILAIDRTGVSPRFAAILANALFQDLGLITAEDISMVIDKSKIARERALLNKVHLEKKFDNYAHSALYFDGRKKKTLIQEKKGETFHRKEIVQEQIVVLQEPGEKFLGHLTPKSGTGLSVANSLFEFTEEKEIDFSPIGNLSLLFYDE